MPAQERAVLSLPFLRLCRWSGCIRVADASRYCERHRAMPPQQDTRKRVSPRAARFRPKPSHWRRTYGSRRWRAFRKSYLSRHPWCVECAKRNRMEQAVEVDHIVPFDPAEGLQGFWREENGYQPLCKSHHSSKTQRERWARIKAAERDRPASPRNAGSDRS